MGCSFGGLILIFAHSCGSSLSALAAARGMLPDEYVGGMPPPPLDEWVGGIVARPLDGADDLIVAPPLGIVARWS